MLKVFETTDAGFDLSDAQGKRVGWIRGNALCFARMRSEEEAIAAAIAGSDALATYLRRSFGATVPPADPRAPVRLVHDGAYEWISRGVLPLARLHRPRSGGGGRRADYRIEFVLPSYVRAGAVIGAAQQVHRAIAELAAPCEATVGAPAGGAGGDDPPPAA